MDVREFAAQYFAKLAPPELGLSTTTTAASASAPPPAAAAAANDNKK